MLPPVSQDCARQEGGERAQSEETPHSEPTAEDEECYDYEAHGDMDDETRDILNLVKTNAVSNDPGVTIGDFKFDRGLNYDWSQRMFPARDAMSCLKGGPG